MLPQYEEPNLDLSYPYAVKTHNIMAGIVWCHDNINDWKYIGNRTIAFRDEKDALMFSLRWAGENL